MPRRIDAQSAADYWASGLANSTQKVQAGIDRVSVAPGAKAAQKKDKYLAGVNASVDTWARNVASVSLSEWQNAAKQGTSRIAEGAQNKKQKYADRVQAVFSHMDGVLAQVDNMPDNTLEQRIAKSAAFQRGMAGFKRRSGQ